MNPSLINAPTFSSMQETLVSIEGHNNNEMECKRYNKNSTKSSFNFYLVKGPVVVYRGDLVDHVQYRKECGAGG